MHEQIARREHFHSSTSFPDLSTCLFHTAFRPFLSTCDGFTLAMGGRQCVSLLLLAGLGVPLALVESLPYMMVGMFSPRENHGQLLGKLNVWIGESLGLIFHGARPGFDGCRRLIATRTLLFGHSCIAAVCNLLLPPNVYTLGGQEVPVPRA